MANENDAEDAKDETYVYEDELGLKKLYRFPIARKIGKRFGMSSRAMTHMINSVLEDLNMDHLYVAATTVANWNSEDGKESLENYEEKHQGLVCVKFDGGTEKIALGHNQYTSKHLLTVMKEGFESPDPKYINHEVCGKSGLEMASNVVSVLKSTKSLKICKLRDVTQLLLSTNSSHVFTNFVK